MVMLHSQSCCAFLKPSPLCVLLFSKTGIEPISFGPTKVAKLGYFCFFADERNQGVFRAQSRRGGVYTMSAKSFCRTMLKTDASYDPTCAALLLMYSLLSHNWLGHSATGKISPPQNAVHLKPHVCLQATSECLFFF